MIISWFPEETMKPASAFSDNIMLLYSKFRHFMSIQWNFIFSPKAIKSYNFLQESYK